MIPRPAPRTIPSARCPRWPSRGCTGDGAFHPVCCISGAIAESPPYAVRGELHDYRVCRSPYDHDVGLDGVQLAFHVAQRGRSGEQESVGHPHVNICLALQTLLDQPWPTIPWISEPRAITVAVAEHQDLHWSPTPQGGEPGVLKRALPSVLCRPTVPPCAPACVHPGSGSCRRSPRAR